MYKFQNPVTHMLWLDKKLNEQHYNEKTADSRDHFDIPSLSTQSTHRTSPTKKKVPVFIESF